MKFTAIKSRRYVDLKAESFVIEEVSYCLHTSQSEVFFVRAAQRKSQKTAILPLQYAASISPSARQLLQNSYALYRNVHNRFIFLPFFVEYVQTS